ncbi:MAG: hypothetical protein OEM96_06675, partial [Gemmatimonadota bacterium]|nr:hypothetical protein [Gemmatimonadota bacterium]
MTHRWRTTALALLLLMLGAGGCATLQRLAALRAVTFAIDSVAGGRLAGVDLSGIATPEDVRPLDAGRIAAAVLDGRLPLEFTVNVSAENPADNSTAAEMIRLEWTLLLDDRETIAGAIDDHVLLPPGEPQIIPVAVRLDLMEFFAGAAPELLGLALRFAGADADAADVKLRAVPTVSTPMGLVDYPATITIVSGTPT